MHKVIVLCNTSEEVNEVNNILQVSGIKTVAVDDETMEQSMINDVEQIWISIKNSAEPSGMNFDN